MSYDCVTRPQKVDIPWTNADFGPIWALRKNFESKYRIFFFKENAFENKCQPFCLCSNVLRHLIWSITITQAQGSHHKRCIREGCTSATWNLKRENGKCKKCSHFSNTEHVCSFERLAPLLWNPLVETRKVNSLGPGRCGNNFKIMQNSNSLRNCSQINATEHG